MTRRTRKRKGGEDCDKLPWVAKMKCKATKAVSKKAKRESLVVPMDLDVFKVSARKPVSYKGKAKHAAMLEKESDKDLEDIFGAVDKKVKTTTAIREYGKTKSLNPFAGGRKRRRTRKRRKKNKKKRTKKRARRRRRRSRKRGRGLFPGKIKKY